MTVKALEDFEISRKDAERAKNMFALGLLSWLYNRPLEGTRQVPGVQVRQQARDPGGEHRGLPGRLELRRDHRGLLGPVRGQAGHAASRAPTATSPATSRWPTAWSPRRGGPGCRCSSAPTRSPRPRTSCTSCPSTSGSASAPSRPRTRSPASAPRSAPRSAARSASPPPPAPAWRSRRRRSGWPSRSSCRWSSATSSGPARPPACRPRPSRPTCCMALFGRNGEAPVAGGGARPRRRTASTPRSRRSGSRSSTARR